MPMRIAVDAMGGDHAPRTIVEGVVMAAREGRPGRELILVGIEEEIRAELELLKAERLPVEIVHASETIEMHEKPVDALRKKKDSSIGRTIDLVRERKAEAAVSAGNTGAMVAASLLKLRTLKGIDRPAITVLMPNPVTGVTVLLDGGANAECKPMNLKQFGVMGSIYAQEVLGVEKPRVGLLSMGEEESKGIPLTREGYALLDKEPVNFIGNVEGNDVFDGTVDVVVCDGFTGNVLLKMSEALAGTISKLLKRESRRTLSRLLGALLMRPAFQQLKKAVDATEHGGAPLLGINGTVIICHGGSNAVAMLNAIRAAERFIEHNVNEHITRCLSNNGALTGGATGDSSRTQRLA
ncbi:MAG: phosphate acyltransferase PlsX [Verrucomicrobia bacterium]|nr:phosphate acyltransferase PlsX [Verrucomicrobiota bacterium]